MVMIMIIREYRYKVLISWVVSHWVCCISRDQLDIVLFMFNTLGAQ